MIYSRSDNDHMRHLGIVLRVLKDNQLFAKFSKCKFWLRSIVFIGHIVSSEGEKVYPRKTEVVKSLPRTFSVTEI